MEFCNLSEVVVRADDDLDTLVRQGRDCYMDRCYTEFIHLLSLPEKGVEKEL